MFTTNTCFIGRALILLLRLPHNSLINNQLIVSLFIIVFIMIYNDANRKFA